MLALWFESTARIAVWICRCVGTGAHVYPASRYLPWCVFAATRRGEEG